MSTVARAHEALARTSQLINADFFDGKADEEEITAELRRTLIRVVADENNVSSASGQTALVSLVQLAAMMGFDVELRAIRVDDRGNDVGIEEPSNHKSTSRPRSGSRVRSNPST